MVARALVQPKAWRVPLQLLNFKSEYVTIPSRVELATLESTEPPPEGVVASVPTQPANLDPNKVELLENIVAKSAQLCDEEKELALLAQHAYIFAASKSNLGQTSKLQHEIETGETRPIQQAVH